jgi:hypothetical protein
MPSLKKYFKVSKPIRGAEDDCEETISAPRHQEPSVPSESEKDASRWPPQFEPDPFDNENAMHSSVHTESGTSPAGTESLTKMKNEVIAIWIHSKQEEKIWTTGQPGEGVVIRQAKGRYICCPTELQYDESNFCQMVAQLNVCVCPGRMPLSGKVLTS